MIISIDIFMAYSLKRWDKNAIMKRFTTLLIIALFISIGASANGQGNESSTLPEIESFEYREVENTAFKQG